MRARHKAKVIEIELFDELRHPYPIGVLRRGDDYAVWNTKHETFLRIESGDLLQIDDPDDLRQIDPKSFMEHYEVINAAGHPVQPQRTAAITPEAHGAAGAHVGGGQKDGGGAVPRIGGPGQGI